MKIRSSVSVTVHLPLANDHTLFSRRHQFFSYHQLVAVELSHQCCCHEEYNIRQYFDRNGYSLGVEGCHLLHNYFHLYFQHHLNPLLMNGDYCEPFVGASLSPWTELIHQQRSLHKICRTRGEASNFSAPLVVRTMRTVITSILEYWQQNITILEKVPV